ncbi:MAG: tetratricopeptide repeat protein [Acidobacteria bacterium]|nr:tetratricopeptide repeat protein [Acidobacteriota bacterium]
MTLRSRAVFVVVVATFALSSGAQQAKPTPASAPTAVAGSSTVLILPFENASAVPGIEWIGEAFPEVMGARLADAGMYVISREDRLRAYDRLSIPVGLRPSRATLYRIAQEMDADFAVLGRYSFDGQTFAASSQVLDIRQVHLGSEYSERGPLPSLMEISNSLAWDVLRGLRPDAPERKLFLASAPAVRLDALENYIRGITASGRAEQIRRLREAVRLAPDYQRAIYQLGKAYFDSKDYAEAIAWLTKLNRESADFREGTFFAALAAYYAGDYTHAAEWFGQLAARIPLTEVYNDRAVAEARLGKASALEDFERAAESDPTDEDYRYNYGLALYRAGDAAGASRQLREAARMQPADGEAKALLELISNSTPYAAAGSKAGSERIKRNYDEAGFRQAEIELERVTEARLQSADAATHAHYHLERGRELMNEGLPEEAERHLREACRLEPQDGAAHSALATVLEREGDFTAARTEANAANAAGASAEAFVVLSRLDMRSGDLNSARENVNRALALEPGNAAAGMLQREIEARRSGRKPEQE